MSPSSPFKTKEFKALKAKWDKKLEKSGFDDIERDGNLKLFHSVYFADPRRYDENVVEAKHQYYNIAGVFLNEHKFANTLEKKIWQLHSEGKSIREIEKALAKVYRTYKDHIHKTLQALQAEMINKCKTLKTPQSS